MTIPLEQLREFCRRRNISELSLFGSVLRDDFGPDSDIDVLVSFVEGVPLDIETWMAMKDELEALFGRHVDLVSKRALKNPFRKHAILHNRAIIYAA